MQTGPDLEFETFGGDRHAEVVGFLPEWQRLVDGHDSHYLQYQSPAWWEHLVATGQQQSVCVLRIAQGERLVGVVPMQARTVPVWLAPARAGFSRVSISCLEVLGGQPLLPADEGLARRLLESIFAQCSGIQALYFKSVAQTSPWFDLLIGAAHHARGCFPLIIREETFHYLTLPESFDGFLQRFTKKKRYNLKRQLRLMEEAYGGKLNLECITRADQVDALLEACSTVAAASWKQTPLTRALERNAENHLRYADLASRGLLRAYVLWDDRRPVAYALGYTFAGTYHYSDIAYAESEVHLSPGAVLLLLIIRDLIGHTSLRQLNFGISDADYKRQFADQHTRDRSVLVFRASPRNRVVAALHAMSAKATAWIRSMVRAADGSRAGGD